MKIFGSSKPVFIGERWDVDGAYAKESLAESASMQATSIKGQSTLVGRNDVLGVPGLEISSAMTAVVAMPGPNGFSGEGEMNVQVQGTFPEDTADAIREVSRLTMAFDATLTNPEQGVRIEMSMRKSGSETYTPM